MDNNEVAAKLETLRLRLIEMKQHAAGTPAPQEHVASKALEELAVGLEECISALRLDVTEQKRAAEALREGEHRYRQLVHALPAAVFTCDVGGHITLYNEAAVALWGREPQPGKDLWCGSWRMYNPDGSPLSHEECPMAVTIREDRPVRGQEIVIERPDGTRSYVLPYPDPIRDASGAVVGAVNMLVDLSARRHQEEALKESEERFATIFRTSPVATAISTLAEGRFLDVNDSFLRLHDYRRDEVIGRTSLELGMWSNVDDRQRFAQTVREQHSIHSAEMEYRTRSGELRHCLRSAELIELSGEPCILGLIQDITERKHAEEALRKSEEQLRLALQAADMGIWEWDIRAGKVIWSSTLEANHGLAPGTFGGTLDDVIAGIHAEDREFFVHSITRAVEQGTEYSIEYRSVWPDGDIHWMEGRGQLFHDMDGQPLRMIGVCMDITERKRAEEALHESEMRLRLALEAARMEVWEWNAATDELRHLVHGHASLTPALGAKDDVMTTPEFLQTIYADDRDRVRQAIAGAKESKQPFLVQFRVPWPDGSLYWIEGRGETLFDENGQATRMIGVSMDVTERKRAEEAQQHLLQRLVTAQEEERRRIARELHDEMGQHITALTLGLKSLQGSGQRPDLDAERINQLQQLQVVTGQLMQEVRRLAWELRPSGLGNQNLEVELQHYVQQWSQRFGVAADFHSNGMQELCLPPHVETTLYRVVQEALTNVAKHAQAHRVSVLLEHRNHHIHAIVEDDGKGFDVDAVLAQRHGQGALGLIGMQERVALMNGSLEIESTLGAGTTIFAHAPITTATTFTTSTAV